MCACYGVCCNVGTQMCVNVCYFVWEPSSSCCLVFPLPLSVSPYFFSMAMVPLLILQGHGGVLFLDAGVWCFMLFVPPSFFFVAQSC